MKTILTEEFGRKLACERFKLFLEKMDANISDCEWRRIFASCIGGEERISSDGWINVIRGQKAWSAKTVKNKNPFTVRNIRLISGRNSPDYSLDIENVHAEDPNRLGEMILGIWNGRITEVRKKFTTTRTVVLIKGEGLETVSVFEEEALRFIPEDYYWEWNSHDNLEGYERTTDKEKFTWQPHGSQFTISTTAPDCRLKLRIRKPPKLNKNDFLAAIKFDPSWIEVVE
ncbi:MAG: hypothetical protein IKR48_00400 [Kiritimatiellae bacterium]|nr:hypothetical protein [Kiritimatiellia bacterium]